MDVSQSCESMCRSPAEEEEDVELKVADVVSVEELETIPKVMISNAKNKRSKEFCKVQCRLETKELWDKFHDLGTEMIITKTGR